MRKIAPFSLLLVLCLPIVASAQAELAIDRGSVTFGGQWQNPQGRFLFQGPEQQTTLVGGFRDGSFSPLCAPCAGGQTLLVRSVYSGSLSMNPGTWSTWSEVRGVYYSGQVTVDSTQTRIPYRFSRLPFKISIPITMHGALEAHVTNPFTTNNPIARFTVHLQGTATLTFKLYDIDEAGRPLYLLQGAIYEFPPPPAQETPEN